MKEQEAAKGPAILECKTYRFEDHSKSTAAQKLAYSTAEEIEEWKKKDPISIWTNRLLDKRYATEEDIEKMDELVEKNIDESIEFARQSPLPEIEAAFNLYVCNTT